MSEEGKLKPVLFEQGRYNYHRRNLYRQNLLLKAMSITSNPAKMRQMADIKGVAEFYREMDKLQIRKEYHNALAEHGIDMSFLVNGIKEIILSAESDAVRLKGLETFLKSLGLSDYKENATDSKNSWEDLIVDVSKEEASGNIKEYEIPDYEVIIPETPPEQLKRIEEEKEIGRGLYDK
jgi:hypothetical protein